MAATIKKETEGQGGKSEENGEEGGGSGESGGDPSEPKNGGEHGEGEDLFEGIHPGTWFGEKGEEGWKKGEKENGKSKAEGKKGEDEEGEEGGEGESGGEGDAHEGGGAGGGDGDGEEAGGEGARPAVAAVVRGEADEKGLKFEESEKIQGEGKKEGEEEPNDGGRLQLKTPAERLAGGAQNEEESSQSEKREKDAGRKSDSFPARGGGTFRGNLDEVQGFERKDGENAGHDIENQPAEESKEESEGEGRAGAVRTEARQGGGEREGNFEGTVTGMVPRVLGDEDAREDGGKFSIFFEGEGELNFA